ncbi:MAG: glycosyl hydrolase 115 family protein [Eubacteriales bacterium]|nr:glycosyl hydrolase 115 family protein [Eubacteriales bacterium]
MSEFVIERGNRITISINEKEPPAVWIAAENLKKDLMRVLKTETSLNTKEGFGQILVGTVGFLENIGKYFDLDKLRDETGNFRKEAYILTLWKDRLVIAGTDRRGTIYGIYDFCEQIGVSPWYFWADVPVRERNSITLPKGYEKTDFSSVPYRGIFINDEEELEHWAQLRMGEETIGIHTYEKIFELILRLKGNYIWPAMHVNSFNMKKENGALAERMGIVVGTSHCDMLMRSNNREWLPWITEKGYTDARYDYSIEGCNRQILQEYWRESVTQNKDFEVSYTLGMRGIHDSGFETANLTGETEEELQVKKIRLLERIIADQNQILSEELDKKPLKLFIPYKEVLELYDHGLKIPDEFTMIWSNDNYGYIRRYPSEEERKREGGHGIYYHNSYWSPPGRSYLFLCSTPLAHTKYELLKAYQEGIQKLWILNVGALKPLEMEVEFFMRLAWEAGRKNGRTENVDDFVSQWINRNFTGGNGEKLGPLLNQFSQIANVRKLEMMEDDVFSQTAYGDEGVVRLHKLQEILETFNHVYENLPETEKDAFFQMVLMRIHAVYLTMCQYYYSDRSALCIRQGKMNAAGLYVKETRAYEDARRKMLFYYNHVMAQGKWQGIVTPEDFPPPRTAMYPACTPALKRGKRTMLVHLWNEGDQLSFSRPGTKWLEISNGGEGIFRYRIEAPDWIELSETTGEVETEKRILVTAKEASERREGSIIIRNVTDDTKCFVPVAVSSSLPKTENQEADGAVAISVRGAHGEGFRNIFRLGREEGDLLEGYEEGRKISFPFYLESEGEFLLEIHRFPSLCSKGRIRLGVILDGGEMQTVESLSNDEWRGGWVQNTTDNVEKLYLRLPWAGKGSHTLTLQVIDRYFAISRMVIYTEARKENNLGIIEGNQSLLPTGCIGEWADAFYGQITLKPRKEILADRKAKKDSLIATDHFRKSDRYADRKSPEEILASGDKIFSQRDERIKIDAVTALKQTDFAYTENGNWEYCSSESYGRSGLAVYIRKRGMRWEKAEDAPKLNYQILCGGGQYDLWILLRIDRAEPSYLELAVDGVYLDKGQLYNQGKCWRYEAEQVWRWIPFTSISLMEGQHLLTFAVRNSGIRMDRIYMTKKEGELPPADLQWEEKQ